MKIKLYAIGGAVLTFLALVARNMMLKGQLKRSKKNERVYKAQVKQAEAIEKVDAEIDMEYSDLEREAKRDIKRGQMPDNIRNRNSW